MIDGARVKRETDVEWRKTEKMDEQVFFVKHMYCSRTSLRLRVSLLTSLVEQRGWCRLLIMCSQTTT